MPYALKWQKYRKQSRLYWLAVIFLVLDLAIGLPLAVSRLAPILFYIFLFASGAIGFVLCVSGYYRSYWACPRCQKPFFRNPNWRGTLMYNLFARHCANCGLPKWAEADSEAQQQNTGNFL